MGDPKRTIHDFGERSIIRKLPQIYGTSKVSTMSRTAEISISVTDPTKCTEKFGSVYIRSAEYV